MEVDSFARSLLDRPALLTGVLIVVDDQGRELLGNLKLNSTGAVSAAARLNGSRSTLLIEGCLSDCTPETPNTSLIEIPVVDDGSADVVGLDLAALGGDFRLSSLLPDDRYTVLSTETTLVETSNQLFIFDIEAQIQRENPSQSDSAQRFRIVARWTLTLPFMLHDDFRELTPRDDIGLFVTGRSQTRKATRWRLQEPVHFVVKGVPPDHQAAFEAGLEDWNVLGQANIGQDIVSYEFIPAGDPRETSIVTGDIRANVIEWDLKNVAS
ncbi:MAG: hypothetical protein AAFV29_06810, partial [Myxococcota bacterium]